MHLTVIRLPIGGSHSIGMRDTEISFMEMLATSQMKRNMAFELKTQFSEPLENRKVLCKFFKVSNFNDYNVQKSRNK